MRRFDPTPRKDDRGIVAVEFVLVFPFLVLMLFAIVAFGNYLSKTTQATGAARDGARIAALGQSPPSTVNGITVTYSYATGACRQPTDVAFAYSPSHTVTATATTTYNLDIPLYPGSGTKTITQTVVMACSG
ncbi:MAG TPA: TadE family protein [Acidimicrobiales bacterium]|nr:TadE family protein [Acidimicrobiales bacterium]